jgi:hypothetical protein
LEPSKIFKVIELIPDFSKIREEITPAPITFMDIPKINYTKITQVDTESLFASAIDYKNHIKVWSPLLLVITIIASICGICCCCNRNARQYCTTFWLCRPSATWEGRIIRRSNRNSIFTTILQKWVAKAQQDQPLVMAKPIEDFTRQIVTEQINNNNTLLTSRYAFPCSLNPSVTQRITFVTDENGVTSPAPTPPSTETEEHPVTGNANSPPPYNQATNTTSSTTTTSSPSSPTGRRSCNGHNPTRFCNECRPAASAPTTPEQNRRMRQESRREREDTLNRSGRPGPATRQVSFQDRPEYDRPRFPSDHLYPDLRKDPLRDITDQCLNTDRFYKQHP